MLCVDVCLCAYGILEIVYLGMWVSLRECIRTDVYVGVNAGTTVAVAVNVAVLYSISFVSVSQYCYSVVSCAACKEYPCCFCSLCTISNVAWRNLKHSH
jgi:hypothetical protein